jgi:predicted dehydrogenase
MDNIRVAFAGAGNMAEEHAKVFLALDHVQLVGVTSRTKARAIKFADQFSISEVCSSIPELYQRTEPDLLVIAVPELETKSVAFAAFDFPWRILIEKPAGYNLDEGNLILNRAEEKNVEVYVGLNRRFYSSAIQISDGLLASPSEKRFIYVQDQQSVQDAINIGQPQIVAENYMYANSIHLIDLIPLFCRGKPTSINNILPWRGCETERVLSVIHFSDGDIAVYDGVWKGPGPWSCSVSTTAARWTMQPLEELQVQFSGERKREQLSIDDVDLKFKPGLFKQNVAVISAIRGQESVAVSLDQSYTTMQLISRIFE